MQNGVDTSYDQYRKATADLEVLKLTVDAILADYDAVLCPSAPGEALKGHAFTGSAIFNGLWTMLGVPSVTLPVQSGPQGLPMGIQLVSGRNSDRKLFDVAQSISTKLRNL
jgi:Asp-tRNA(Asn)/Glu-tRNA(Gln) amidotransferase A subunit family amidase